MTVPWATVVAAVATSSFEMYDFMIFGYLASFIGDSFFPPSSSKLLRLTQAFATYSAAFFMRPIGGVIFGRIGDRQGRKAALVRSTALMAVPSLLIGLLPTYDQLDAWVGWGLAATLSLVLLRLLQGIALGGQLAGSYVLLVERAPRHQRGFFGAVVSSASATGAGVASGVVAIAAAVSGEAMGRWGWRLPFLLGGVCAPLTILAALHFHDDDHHGGGGGGGGGGGSLEKAPLLAGASGHSSSEDMDKSDEGVYNGRNPNGGGGVGGGDGGGNPLFIVVGRERRRLVLMIGSLAASAGCYYFKVWMLTYLASLAQLVSFHQAALVSSATLLLE